MLRHQVISNQTEKIEIESHAQAAIELCKALTKSLDYETLYEGIDTNVDFVHLDDKLQVRRDCVQQIFNEHQCIKAMKKIKR